MPDLPPPGLWLDDLRLARAVKAGEALAIAEFSKRMGCVPSYLSALNAQKGRPLGPEDLADLSQDTLILIWKKLETFKGLATLETWSWRFCQLEFSNRTRAIYRRKAMVAVAAQDAEYTQKDAAHYDVHGDSGTHEVESVLQALGPPAEEIVRMKHFEKLTFDQIAARIGTSAGTAKTRYYRGLIWMKDRLAGAEDDQ